MANLTTLANVKLYLGLTDASEDALLNLLIPQISAEIERYCDRTFASTTYTRERYDGDGSRLLILHQYPVISLSQISVDTITVLEVSNTSTDAQTATIEIGTASAVLTVTGGANAGTDTLTYAANTTVTALAAAINALGKGWDADVATGYGAIPTTGLISEDAYFCLDQVASIYIPNTPIWDYTVYRDKGEVYYRGGFRKGELNVFVNYTAGYTTIPSDLEAAAIEIIAFAYRMSKRDPTLNSERLGDYSWSSYATNYLAQYPSEQLKRLLGPFKRWYVG